MQALCYFCRKWFHVKCLDIIDSEKAKAIRASKWDPQVPLQLLQFAMATMRRGHLHTIAGDYGRVYQAQSILSAYVKGDERRLEAWLAKENFLAVEPVIIDSGDLYLCPTCHYVI